MAWQFYLIAAIAIAALCLWLMSLAEVALALLFKPEESGRREASIIAVNTAEPSHIARRTVPRLRAHRPAEVAEAQRRWREAAEAHRRRLRRAS